MNIKRPAWALFEVFLCEAFTLLLPQKLTVL